MDIAGFTSPPIMFFLSIIVVFFLIIGYNRFKKYDQKMKSSQEGYRLLFQRLDHFSQDLYRVIKVTDLENRLIHEVEEVLNLKNIYIIEIDERLNLYRSTGGSTDFHEMVLEYFDQTVPIGEVAGVGSGCFVKIGETNGKIILLCIENDITISLLQPQRIWLKTISRYVSVLYDTLFTIEDMAKELEQRSLDKSTPSWIFRLLFLVSEKERMRLSSDLHDSVLQNQILWYRKMEALRSDSTLSPELELELRKIEKGMLELIQQTRATCNNLRPPYLKEQGLIKAMESLLSYNQSNVDFKIDFDYTDFDQSLNEEEMVVLYRIAQELLANARKHSFATKVEFRLSNLEDHIYFSYQDDGVGMDVHQSVGSFDHIGLDGIKKRVDSIEGDIELYSAPGKGVNILISFPMKESNHNNSMLLEVFK